MIGMCLGNNRKGVQKDEKKPKKTEPSSFNGFLQKNIDRVSSFIETIFDTDSSEISENDERRSHLTNNIGQTSLIDKNKQKSRFQGNNSIFSPSGSVKTSFKSDETFAENHKIYSEDDWLQILKANDLSYTEHLDLLASLRSGIPDNLRPRIWFFLSKINELKKSHAEKIYYRLKSSKSNADDDILKDIPRTYPECEFLVNNKDNQQKLFNILRAYANYDSVLGYTQGMNFVVATLLIILNPKNYESLEYSFGLKNISDEEYEERVFWIFIYIAYKKNWREVYKDGMVKTFDLLSFFKKKMISEIPDIYDHILDQGLDLQMCFDHAFITILLYYSPFDFSKRIIDLFLIKGENVIFEILIRMMMLSKSELLCLDTTETLFNYLRKTMISKCFENSAKDCIKFLLPVPQLESISFSNK